MGRGWNARSLYSLKAISRRVLRLGQSQLGGWSRAAERLTIGQVTEAARREGGVSSFCRRIPSLANITAGRGRGTAGWKAVSPAAQDRGLKAIRAGTLVRAKQALQASSTSVCPQESLLLFLQKGISASSEQTTGRV